MTRLLARLTSNIRAEIRAAASWWRWLHVAPGWSGRSAKVHDATASLRLLADSQTVSYQCESPRGLEHFERGLTSRDVYTRASRPCVRGHSSPRAVPTRTAAILAEAYEIGDPGQVQIDARDLTGWTLPLDDFATRLGTVHRWKAETVVIYIGALRSALLDRHAPTPWDDL